MTKRYSLTMQLVITFFLMCFGSMVLGETDSKIKLHKGKVSVSSPDNQGRVFIHGQAGAVKSRSRAVTEIVILKTAGTFDVAPDGSFSAQVQADGGDKIRIQARNESKKKSYGTFTVPAQDEASEKNALTTINHAPLSAKVPQVSLAMYINIVDTQTGDLVAKQRLDFMIQTDETDATSLTRQIEQLMSNCRRNIETEVAALSTKTNEPRP